MWAALAPFIFWQAQRFPLERGRLLWRLPINLLMGLLLTLLYTALDLVLRQFLDQRDHRDEVGALRVHLPAQLGHS